jgi:hypothetical protein
MNRLGLLLKQPTHPFKSELTPISCRIIPIRKARLQAKQNCAHQIFMPSHAACGHRTKCMSVPVAPAPCGSTRRRDLRLCASDQTTNARRVSGVCGSCGTASRCFVQNPIRFVYYSCAQCARRGRTNTGRGKTNLKHPDSKNLTGGVAEHARTLISARLVVSEAPLPPLRRVQTPALAKSIAH